MESLENQDSSFKLRFSQDGERLARPRRHPLRPLNCGLTDPTLPRADSFSRGEWDVRITKARPFGTEPCWVFHRPEDRDDGVPGGKINKSIMLEGPAGAGKTELAQSVARAAGADLLRLSAT